MVQDSPHTPEWIHWCFGNPLRLWMSSFVTSSESVSMASELAAVYQPGGGSVIMPARCGNDFIITGGDTLQHSRNFLQEQFNPDSATVALNTGAQLFAIRQVLEYDQSPSTLHAVFSEGKRPYIGLQRHLLYTLLFGGTLRLSAPAGKLTDYLQERIPDGNSGVVAAAVEHVASWTQALRVCTGRGIGR